MAESSRIFSSSRIFGSFAALYVRASLTHASRTQSPDLCDPGLHFPKHPVWCAFPLPGGYVCRMLGTLFLIG